MLGVPKTAAHRVKIGAANRRRTYGFVMRQKISLHQGGTLPPDYAAAVAAARPEDRNRLRYALRLWRRWNITVEDEARLVAGQQHRCLCGRSFGKWWRIDHDHVSGRIRGVLHHHCNYIVLPWIERAGINNVVRYLAAA